MIRSVFASSWRDKNKAMKHTRVWLNGKEVTRDCQVADDRVGRVLLLKRDANGRCYHDPITGDFAKEWRHGSVRMARSA